MNKMIKMKPSNEIDRTKGQMAAAAYLARRKKFKMKDFILYESFKDGGYCIGAEIWRAPWK